MSGAMPRAHVLAMHAGYRCRHAGVCCTEDWAIPVDAARYLRLSQALESGLLQPEQTPAAWFDRNPETGGPEPVVVGRAGRSCAFFEPGRGRRCSIHRQLGHDALPVACQHFPRVVVADPRGLFVSLSCVCPTAGQLLRAECTRPFQVVHEGAVLLPGLEWMGLDARDSLPPQLSDDVLWDWDALTVWEQSVLKLLETSSAENAIAIVAAAAATVERWRPRGGESLSDAVVKAVATARGESSPLDVDALDGLARDAAAPSHRNPAPPDRRRLDDELVAPVWDSFKGMVNRYLAARTIANAATYQAARARLLATWLATGYSVLRTEASRQASNAGRQLDEGLLVAAAADADRLLVHRLDAARWAASYQRL
jgi:hypothetical protein